MEIIKALRNCAADECHCGECPYEPKYVGSTGCISSLIGAAADALEAADKAQRWIPVSERLPDDVGSYLVYYHEWSNGYFLPKYDDYRIRVMRFMNNGKWCMPVCTDKRCEADTNREVTNWMPLPEPPRKDGEE